MEDYKEKYENALERAKKYHEGHTLDVNPQAAMEYVFPELKENEDERIRKALINTHKYYHPGESPYMDGISNESVIAWLEKQGLLNNDKYQTVPVEILDRLYKSEKELEELKQGEHKLTNNVEPKFKVGDVIKNIYNGDTVKIEQILDNYYCYSGWDGATTIHSDFTISEQDNWELVEKKPTDKVEPKFEIEKGKWYVCIKPRYTNFIVGKVYPSPKDGMLSSETMSQYVAKHCFRLWSIQDAKDGDVLVTPNNNIFIFKEVQNNCHIYAHCGLYFNCFCAKYSCVNGTLSVELPNNYKPSTKEQRDLLFQKMKEAGYEWDAEKKELKDIKEQNSTEDNCKISDWDIKVDTIEYNKGFECGKQRVLKYPEDYGLYRKPACSEEHISIIEKDGEQWVRICALGEDFIIAAHDYKDGDNTKFNWVEACSIGTFSEKQGHIMFALLDEINDRLEEIGGEPLDSLYWSSTDYSSYYAWLMLFSSGSVDINGKYNSHAVRRVIAF